MIIRNNVICPQCKTIYKYSEKSVSYMKCLHCGYLFVDYRKNNPREGNNARPNNKV